MNRIIKEYAEALFSLAGEEQMQKQISDSLHDVLKICGEHSEYTQLLCSPAVSKSERINLIRTAFGGSVPEYVMSFLCILCERGLFSCLDECAEIYDDMLRFSKGISIAYVKSAFELSESQKQALKQKLESKFGHTVKLECSINKELLGGLVITIDGEVLDGSLKHRLQEIKEVMGR